MSVAVCQDSRELYAKLMWMTVACFLVPMEEHVLTELMGSSASVRLDGVELSAQPKCQCHLHHVHHHPVRMVASV